MTYTIRYQYADYRGTRTVNADDEEQAIAKVRRMIRKEGGLPMAYESYKVVSSCPQTDPNQE